MVGGDSSTVYYLGHYGGHALPAFDCKHDHCGGRSQPEFLARLGILDPYEEMVREHARMGGFPANQIASVKTLIDPTTAEFGIPQA